MFANTYDSLVINEKKLVKKVPFLNNENMILQPAS